MAARGGRVSILWGSQSWEAANHAVNGHTPMHAHTCSTKWNLWVKKSALSLEGEVRVGIEKESEGREWPKQIIYINKILKKQKLCIMYSKILQEHCILSLT